jgi:hypothetical protein
VRQGEIIPAKGLVLQCRALAKRAGAVRLVIFAAAKFVNLTFLGWVPATP